MWPLDEFPDINVHSYIGVIIAIAGNILISIALNIQKYAHNQLQPDADTDSTPLHTTTPTYAIEEEEAYLGPAAGAVHPYHGDGEDCGSGRNAHSTHSSNNSRRSSIHSHENDNSYDSDTSEQSDSAYVPLRPKPDNGEDSAATSSISDMDYLQSKAWWAGMTLMILGECGNFLAYGYAQASIIAPLGTVALVSNVILAPLMLREPFRSRDLLGITIAIIGTVVVVINSKENEVKQLTPEAVIAALLQTQFIAYFIVCCVMVAVLASLSDSIGSEYIFIDLAIVAIFGGYTVLATKGVSSLLSLSFYKMFTYPIAYLLVFVLVSTAVLQIKYLNKSLQRFDSTQVIPTQFVLFTTSAIIGSAILYNDFDEMDFNKGLHFLTGCCMTFLGVYFITSDRDKGMPAVPVPNPNAPWPLTPQPYTPVPKRTSFDHYPTGRPLYQPQERNRSRTDLEQGRRPSVPVSIGYPIPPFPPNRMPRTGTTSISAAESVGQNASVPLLGTSYSKNTAHGSKEQGFSLTSTMHNALSAVGSRHTSLLGLEKVMENYTGHRGEDRRGSVASLAQTSTQHLQRPPLGSRSSSAFSGVFPAPSIANYPSSTSLVPIPDHNYGSSYQTHHHPHHNPTPLPPSSQSSSTQVRSGTVHNPTDHRFPAPYLQERSQSHEGLTKQPRHKTSSSLVLKEQQQQQPSRESKETLAPRIKTSGVAVPVRKSGDRQQQQQQHPQHHMSPSEQDFATTVSHSMDSMASSNNKSSGAAAAAAKFLPGAMLSSSPTKHHNHSPQGSEYAFQTLRSPKESSFASSGPYSTQHGASASDDQEQESVASAPSLYPSDSTHPPHLPQQPQHQSSRSKKKASTAGEDSELTDLHQPRRKDGMDQ
ncbi:hypothetical protein KVV02_001287 [Mortierella alpina]|uniref:DUF803 domain membrane protein n=1 Tax=Mortierella alpina TaxID=64518 RepID=A0A9P8AAI6_MORAP|nr:hypothetical protein KVV02_001287 [Mortierella alpina]